MGLQPWRGGRPFAGEGDGPIGVGHPRKCVRFCPIALSGFDRSSLKGPPAGTERMSWRQNSITRSFPLNSAHIVGPVGFSFPGSCDGQRTGWLAWETPENVSDSVRFCPIVPSGFCWAGCRDHRLGRSRCFDRNFNFPLMSIHFRSF